MDSSWTRHRLSGGWALVIAGIAGAASAVFLAFVPPAVGVEQFSYPLEQNAFTAIQLFLFAHHLAVAWGLLVVWRSGFAGDGRLARIGGFSSVASMALLAVHEVVAVSAAGLAISADAVTIIVSIYGVLSLLNGVSLIMFGLAVARSHKWSGWRRFTALALGIYVIVPLTPALFGPFVVARLAIGVWMLLFAALGWALLHPATHDARSFAAATRP